MCVCAGVELESDTLVHSSEPCCSCSVSLCKFLNLAVLPTPHLCKVGDQGRSVKEICGTVPGPVVYLYSESVFTCGKKVSVMHVPGLRALM